MCVRSTSLMARFFIIVQHYSSNAFGLACDGKLLKKSLMAWYHCGSLLSIGIWTEAYGTNKTLKFIFRNREEFSWCKLQHFQVSRLSGQTHNNREHMRLSYQVHCHKRMILRLWINIFVTKNIRYSRLLLVVLIYFTAPLWVTVTPRRKAPSLRKIRPSYYQSSSISGSRTKFD